MHVLVTRPEEDAAEFSAQLAALGHTVTVAPMLKVEVLPVAAEALQDVGGLVATSRNALRALAGSPALAAARALPLIAVGPGTARLAGALRFAHIGVGGGSAADLVPAIVAAAHRVGAPLAHLRGEEVAFDLQAALAAHDILLRQIVCYRTVAAAGLTPQTRELLATGAIDAVTLMSPRTGRTLVRLLAAAGLAEAAQIPAFVCLSAAVAATIEPLGPKRVEIAESPNRAGMLAALARVATLRSGV
jgi:uroporphyrinogen-III synthase